MKKVYILLILFLFLFIPNTYAKDLKYYELTLYDKEKIEEFDQIEELAMLLLMDNGELKLCDGVNEVLADGTYPICDKNDNEIYYGVIKNGEDDAILVNKDVPIDRINYLFTEEDKEFIQSYEIEDNILTQYDGISLILFETIDYECSSVCINKVSLDEKSSTAIIKARPKIHGLELELNGAFSLLDDFFSYKVNIYNPTDKEYELSIEESFSSSEYIKYEYDFDDDDSILKAGSEKVMYITVRYNKEVPENVLFDGQFSENNKATVKLANGVEEDVNTPVDKTTEIKVPDTYTGLSILIVFIIITIAGAISYGKVSKKLWLLLLLFIPIIVNAYEKLELKVETHVEINPLKNVLKKAPAGDYKWDFWEYYNRITTITFLNKIEEKPNEAYRFDVSLEGDGSVIAILVNNPINTHLFDLYIMANGPIIANQDSSYLFANMPWLTKINNVEYLITSNVENMDYMFYKDDAVSNFDLRNFKTSKVESMKSMFSHACESVSVCTIDLGNDFDTSKVKNMSDMFSFACGDTSECEINLGSKFNIKSAQNLSQMFLTTGVSSLDLIINDIYNLGTLNEAADVKDMFCGTGFDGDFTLPTGYPLNAYCEYTHK